VLLFNQLFQRVQVLAEGLSPFPRGAVARVGLSVYKRFFHFYIASAFQGLQVTGEVSIGKPQDFLQGTEVDLVIDHQGRHDAQPASVVKGFVQICYLYFHLSYL